MIFLKIAVGLALFGIGWSIGRVWILLHFYFPWCKRTHRARSLLEILKFDRAHPPKPVVTNPFHGSTIRNAKVP